MAYSYNDLSCSNNKRVDYWYKQKSDESQKYVEQKKLNSYCIILYIQNSETGRISLGMKNQKNDCLGVREYSYR